MMEIYYESVHYQDFIATVCRKFGTRMGNGILTIPSNFGEGYMKTHTLPNGMSVLISDCRFREDFVLQRNCANESWYELQFNETVEAPVLYSTGAKDAFNLLKQMVLLTSTEVITNYFIPANARLKSFRILFQRKHLLEAIDSEVLDAILSRYFAETIQTGVVEPLDVDYRAVLRELLNESSQHPLAVNFLQNRTLLLLEMFLTRFAGQQKGVDKSRLSDNEIVRLMKIESMLVNDFSVTPPNINYLARVSAMSPTKLKSDFKKLYGMPIYEYYQKNRMQRAKNLLLEGKHSIKEVGIQVGYSNLSHFAGSFKKEFGMLPSQFVARDGALAI